MFTVVELRKLRHNQMGHEYELRYKDSEETKPGYQFHSTYGTTAHVRAVMKNKCGLNDAEIDLRFAQIE